MNYSLWAPIGILDEHPEWSARLVGEFTRRGLPWEKIDHSNHAFDPRDRRPAYSVVVNRTSPSSHTRGHAGVLFYAEALLAHLESLGIPVINPLAAYRFEKSKALQLELFERLGVRYPRAVVVNHRDQVLKALDEVRFPLVIKPNVGGSGAGIVRFVTRKELVERLGTLALGPDGTALVQEYVESDGGAIVRVEVLDGRYLYAIRIVRRGDAGFNLCPADICQTSPAPAAAPTGMDLGACPVEAKPGLDVSGFDAPAEAIETVIRLTQAASIEVGGVEYLVSKADGQIYYYDVNATSNFVANAPAVVGFEPTERFVDYIVDLARRGAKPGV
jgi:glutathione synthase/RimK-type ligase-like ATP-grasp enzyme